MLGRSHLLLAGASYAALALHPVGSLTVPRLHGEGLPPDAPLALALGIGLAALGSLAPDLDDAGSSIARSGGLVTRAGAWIVERTLRHRGPLHSALAVVAAFVAGELLGAHFGLHGAGAVVAYGWASHVLTDACTIRGVPLFWPLRRRHLCLPPKLATGGLIEALVVVAGLLICGWWAAAPVQGR